MRTFSVLCAGYEMLYKKEMEQAIDSNYNEREGKQLY
jgi:hypothetical protein